MGSMRFLVLRRDLAPSDAAERATMTGLEEIPWQTRVQWTDEGLLVRRSESESGCFQIPWLVAGMGEIMLATTSLMERAAVSLAGRARAGGGASRAQSVGALARHRP